MRSSLGRTLWLVPMLLPLAGCGPEIPADDLGTVRFEVPAVPGAEKPYEMPELGPKPAADAEAPGETDNP